MNLTSASRTSGRFWCQTVGRSPRHCPTVRAPTGVGTWSGWPDQPRRLVKTCTLPFGCCRAIRTRHGLSVNLHLSHVGPPSSALLGDDSGCRRAHQQVCCHPTVQKTRPAQDRGRRAWTLAGVQHLTVICGGRTQVLTELMRLRAWPRRRREGFTTGCVTGVVPARRSTIATKVLDPDAAASVARSALTPSRKASAAVGATAARLRTSVSPGARGCSTWIVAPPRCWRRRVRCGGGVEWNAVYFMARCRVSFASTLAGMRGQQSRGRADG